MIRTTIKTIIFWIAAFCAQFRKKHPIIYALVRSLLVCGPTVILGYVAINLEKDLPGQTAISLWLSNHPRIVIALLVWTFLTYWITHASSQLINNYKDGDNLKVEELTNVLSALDRVVGSKYERFANYALSPPSDREAGQTFIQITQPKEQIKCLILNLYMVLISLTDDVSLKIVLARMENDLPVAWETFMPNNVHPDNTILKRKTRTSLFSKCSLKKEPIVISDIAKHAADARINPATSNYQPSSVQSQDFGSIIGYPIKYDHSGKIVYALSIKSDNPGFICEAFEKKYSDVVEQFKMRIKLEHSLEIIKSQEVKHAK